MTVLAVVPIVMFGLLALVHVYWALGDRAAWGAAIPEIDGRRAFTPSAGITLAVAGALFLCAGLVAATSRLFDVPVPARLLTWLAFGLSLLLLLRAVGDFHLIGFFKRVRGTRFANLDTAVYSPLCLVLAVGVFMVAYANHT